MNVQNLRISLAANCLEKWWVLRGVPENGFRAFGMIVWVRFSSTGLTKMQSHPDSELLEFARMLAAGDFVGASRQISNSPALARARIQGGATRQSPNTYFFDCTGVIYAGHTLLHMASAAHQPELVQQLITSGADIRAKNRRGAEPLHAAAVGNPNTPHWSPEAQTATIATLLNAGADPNACNNDGATPLHRAVRTRCAPVVKALIDGGADVHLKNKGGSTPISLASKSSGWSGGSGTPKAKAQQREILRLFDSYDLQSS